jgi:hypothetical protein
MYVRWEPPVAARRDQPFRTSPPTKSYSANQPSRVSAQDSSLCHAKPLAVRAGPRSTYT